MSRVSVSDHAIERWRERIEPGATVDEAQERIEAALARATYLHRRGAASMFMADDIQLVVDDKRDPGVRIVMSVYRAEPTTNVVEADDGTLYVLPPAITQRAKRRRGC